MLKPYSIFFLLIVLCNFSCDKTNFGNDGLKQIKYIDQLHALAKNKVSDSALIYIEEARQIIDNNKNLPDTLLIENLFRKGHYYKLVEQFDSAMFYFHQTIDLIEGPNNRKRNLVYFRNTWEMDKDNNKIANGISVAQKLIKISNSSENSEDLVYANNFLERAYINLNDFEKSLYYNSKTLEMAKQSSNINMYVITGNSKARTLYAHLGKKKEAFALLDSLSTIDCGKDAKRQLYRVKGRLYFNEKKLR